MMRFTYALAAICLTLAIPARAQTPPPTLAVPNTNSKAPTGPSVQIETCKLHADGNALAATTGQTEIEFTNEGTTTADLIRFRIMWGTDSSSYIRDSGTFSPGITINHKFRQTEGVLISLVLSNLNLRCAIDSVHFVDGSTWTNPNVNDGAVSGNVVF